MTQRTKNKLLIVGGILLLGIAYQYGIAKTIKLRKQVALLTQQKELDQNAAVQLATLANTEKQLDAVLAKHNVAGNSLQHTILTTLNALAKNSNFKIIAFEKPHHYHDKNSKKTTTTYAFTLKGNYKAIIAVVYAFEQKYSFGNIIQVAFEKKKNFRTKKNTLQAKVLLQRIH